MLMRITSKQYPEKFISSPDIPEGLYWTVRAHSRSWYDIRLMRSRPLWDKQEEQKYACLRDYADYPYEYRDLQDMIKRVTETLWDRYNSNPRRQLQNFLLEANEFLDSLEDD